METYLIVRRNGWRTADELQEAARRSTAEGERMAARALASHKSFQREHARGAVAVA
jgi:hypothetical protein